MIDGAQTPTTKVCKGCAQELAIGQFYPHAQMRDGHLNYCKSCVKRRVTEHRLKNVERIRDYDRNRPNKLARLALNAASTKRRRAEIPGYGRAHAKVNHAKKMGVLAPPEVCSECGSPSRLVAHHEDYSKPLDVIWLCQPCHVGLHLRGRRSAS